MPRNPYEPSRRIHLRRSTQRPEDPLGALIAATDLPADAQPQVAALARALSEQLSADAGTDATAAVAAGLAGDDGAFEPFGVYLTPGDLDRLYHETLDGDSPPGVGAFTLGLLARLALAADQVGLEITEFTALGSAAATPDRTPVAEGPGDDVGDGDALSLAKPGPEGGTLPDVTFAVNGVEQPGTIGYTLDSVPANAADVIAWIAAADDDDDRAARATAAGEVEQARGEQRKTVAAAIASALSDG